MKVVKIIAKRAADRGIASAKDMSRRVYYAVSMALQRGNYLIAAEALCRAAEFSSRRHALNPAP